MPVKKLFSSFKRSPLSALSTSRRNVDGNASSCRTIRKRTSVEDLIDQGYFLGRELGEGSYCKVREASFNGEKMAVKIITRSKISQTSESKFLPREIEVLCKTRHKNIIHVYKIFSYPRRVFIFMELVERGDLLEFVKNRGRLMEAETRHYFKQMVSGMQYLHSLNYAHRDLKCENIMINDADEIKIVDFGFSRLTVNKQGRRQLSETYCGSTAYAAPEVLQGIPYNPIMEDVWSMGCILFIMITGTPPFDDSSIPKMVSNQLKKRFKYPDAFTVSKEIKTIISRMLEPDVMYRANLNQISGYSWIKESKGDHLSHSCMSMDGQ